MSQELGQELVSILPRLRRFAYGLCGSVEEGDDLVQAACERALARTDQFETGTRLDAWMYKILQSIWIDRLRKRKHREIAMEQEYLESFPGGDAAAEAESRLSLGEVRRAIAKLPEEQRVVLLLVSVEGLSYREAAAVLGCPIGTVMSRLSRARLALGESLENRGQETGRVIKFPR